MTGVVQGITPDPWQVPSLSDIVITNKTSSTVIYPRDMSADRLTVYGTVGATLRQSVDDGTTWTTIWTAPAGIEGFWLLPNGEAIASTKPGGQPGKLYVSSGFKSNPSSATWTLVLETSRPDTYFHANWGLGMAPKGHVREGLVVVCDYGWHGQAGENGSTSHKVSLSLDYGRTWKTIWNLFERVRSAGQHIHGCAYDQWTDSIYVSYGDGMGSTGATNGVVSCNDFLSSSPTWENILGPVTGDFQCTWIFPMEDCILFGGDGAPPGYYRLPRTGRYSFASDKSRIPMAVNLGGGSDGGFIGQKVYQHSPGLPILFGVEYNKNVANIPPTLLVAEDSRHFAEVWADTTYGADSKYPLSHWVGPTARGKVVGQIKRYKDSVGSSLWSNIVATYRGGE